MAKTKPSEENKKIARYLAAVFEDKSHVQQYNHDQIDLHINILWSPEHPRKNGFTYYGTIGLSDYVLKGFPHRLEFVGVCMSEFDYFPNILATASFIIMRTGQLYSPGSVMPNVVKEYVPATKLPHLYFTSPFSWKDKLQEFDLGTKIVNFLQVVPISESERLYLEKNGEKKFEDLLEKKLIDVTNMNRDSVVE